MSREVAIVKETKQRAPLLDKLSWESAKTQKWPPKTPSKTNNAYLQNVQTVSTAWYVCRQYKSTCKASDFWQFQLLLVCPPSGRLRIRAGWRDWLLLDSQSDCGCAVPDCGCRKAGNEPHLPVSAGHRRSLQTGSKWGAANWGWRRSHLLAEGLQGFWWGKEREREMFRMTAKYI